MKRFSIALPKTKDDWFGAIVWLMWEIVMIIVAIYCCFINIRPDLAGIAFSGAILGLVALQHHEIEHLKRNIHK